MSHLEKGEILLHKRNIKFKIPEEFHEKLANYIPGICCLLELINQTSKHGPDMFMDSFILSQLISSPGSSINQEWDGEKSILSDSNPVEITKERTDSIWEIYLTCFNEISSFTVSKKEFEDAISGKFRERIREMMELNPSLFRSLTLIIKSLTEQV